jgi:hypothetical protein
MRVPEGPRWGSRTVERWVAHTTRQMRSDEVGRVTFEAVWRGGVKRRLLTNKHFRRHRLSCERAMALGSTWNPPPDRIQARLWSCEKQYVSSLTWQIDGHPKPRPLRRGEIPQPPPLVEPQGEEAPQTAPEEIVALCSALDERLSELESAPEPPTVERVDALERSLRSMEARLLDEQARLSAVEEENRFLRESIYFVWNGLSDPLLADLYQGIIAINENLGLQWDFSEKVKGLPKKWPNSG